MDNSIINLKKEYRDFIKKSSTKIEILNIDENNLNKEKCCEVIKLYNEIYTDLETSALNINDINHIILNYKKDDPDVERFKKFIKIKNAYLIRKTLQSTQLQSFISKLKEEIDLGDKKLNKKITEQLLIKGVFRLLKQYLDMFRGCWEIVDFNDDKIKKIDIVEPEHYKFLKNYLNNKINN